MSEKIQQKVDKAIKKQFMDFQHQNQSQIPSNNRCPLSCWDIFSMIKKNNACKK